MKSRIQHILTRAGVFLAVAVSCCAQSWQMILPNPAAGAAPTGMGNDVLINPFTTSPAPGVFLAIGGATGESSIYRLTPINADSSTFAIEPADSGLLIASKLAYRPSDGLYAAGAAVSTGSRKSTSTQFWKVRRSPEAGLGNPGTWLDDDTFQFSSTAKNLKLPLNSRAMGIAADRDGKVAGNVFVCGWASDGNVNHWIIRKRALAGGWSTVLDLKAADGYSMPVKMCFVPQGGNNPTAAFFAVGILNDRWTVLRSLNQGASWQAVGPWPTDGSQASAYDVASDSLGNIYVVGSRGRDGYNRGWVLRKSSDGGLNWTDLLDQPSQLDSWAVRLAIDGADNITLAGAIDNASGSPRWAIVRNSPGQTWADSWATGIFPLGDNATGISKGRGMAADASGNLFLTGDISNWTDPVDSTVVSGTGLLRFAP